MAFQDVKQPLANEEDSLSSDSGWEEFTKAQKLRHRNRTVKNCCFAGFVALPWILLALLGAWARASLQECRNRYYIRPDLTYSPIQDIVEYESRIFTTGFPDDPDLSPYAAEPSDELDKLWTDLYPSLHQLIPLEQAAKLGNKTSLYPHDDQRRYVVELNVFHDLHCLNMIRKATRPDYYHPEIEEGQTEDFFLGHRHIVHCIDAIRQSLMCSSDITVYLFPWVEEVGTYENNVKIPHTCRNFDAIRDWARINTNQEFFDFDYRVPNDPLDPSTWTDGYTGGR